MDLLTHFERRLVELDIALPGDAASQPIVVGVSGGADSLALLHLFTRASAALRLQPHAVHVNHAIRGAAADADAAFVARIAAEWGVPCHVERVDVPALAAERRLSLEEAARQARYTVLGQAGGRLGAWAIAVAHHADDQAETVLMHLLRGAGLAGLRGMLPITPLSDYHLLEPVKEPLVVVRPLLEVPREAIEAYCRAQGLQPRFDRSNLDTTYFRNRLRHEIIPRLEAVNPNLRQTLTRTASVLAADYEVLQEQVDATLRRITLEAGAERVRFELGQWRALPLGLQRATIRRATFFLRQGLRDVSYEHVEGAVEVGLHGATGAEATLPGGLSLRVGYDELLITAEGGAPRAPNWPLLAPGGRLEVAGPGVYALPGTDWQFELARYEGPREGPGWGQLLADPWAAPLDGGRLHLPLTIRTRRPGDRFQPRGVGGSKKVSDFMIDQKIPADWRDRIPLLVSGGTIAWVCGWRVDERFEVGGETRDVWLARFTLGAGEQAAR